MPSHTTRNRYDTDKQDDNLYTTDGRTFQVTSSIGALVGRQDRSFCTTISRPDFASRRNVWVETHSTLLQHPGLRKNGFSICFFFPALKSNRHKLDYLRKSYAIPGKNPYFWFRWMGCTGAMAWKTCFASRTTLRCVLHIILHRYVWRHTGLSCRHKMFT